MEPLKERGLRDPVGDAEAQRHHDLSTGCPTLGSQPGHQKVKQNPPQMTVYYSPRSGCLPGGGGAYLPGPPFLTGIKNELV